MSIKKANAAVRTITIKQDWSFSPDSFKSDKPFVTHWFSKVAFEKKDVYFRLYLDGVRGYPDDPYVRHAFLQVCNGEQRSAVVGREEDLLKNCRLDPAMKELPRTMSISRLSLTMSCDDCEKSENTKELYVNQKDPKSLLLPSEHEFGWFQLKRDDACIRYHSTVSMYFKATFLDLAGDEETPAATTATCSAGASAMLTNLLGTGVLSDVVLHVGGEELRAHRCVLAAASPVFRRMFAHEASEESRLGRVDVQGVRREVMAAALRYLYGQELGADLDVDTLCDLLVLAERYELLPLKKRCEEALIRNGEGDPLQLLTIAMRHNSPRLRETSIKRIADSADRGKLVDSATLQEVYKSHPDVLRELILKL